jgi:hypothetical protein
MCSYCQVGNAEESDGCPTFASAYVGRKRWAQPDDRFLHRLADDAVPEGRLKVAQDAVLG